MNGRGKGSGFVFNSESVTEGHPDKLCDQISDAIVGHYLLQDPLARIAAECCVSSGIVFVAAKYRANATIDIPTVARQVIRRVGYANDGFSADSCTIMTSFAEIEDPDYPRAIDEMQMSDREIDQIPATDQVTVFGYACADTPSYMPVPIWLAHRLSCKLAQVRQEGLVPYLTPDGKAQVGVEFIGGRPSRIHSITLIASHKEEERTPSARIEQDLRAAVIDPIFLNTASDFGAREFVDLRPDRRTLISINPRGEMFTGGPAKHSGLTGRKTAADTYGEYARYCGAALSGKDPSRIDRIGVYAARLAAKNVVVSGLATECEVQLSYVHGLARPVSVTVECFGTALVREEEIARRLIRQFDFRPAGIVKQFGLRFLPQTRGVDFYQQLAAYGQVGRSDLDLPWEATDQAWGLAEKRLKAAR